MGIPFSTIMDPLSCLAIAGAVMQVITFGNEMIGLYHNIKKNGSPDDGLEGKCAQIATNSKLIKDNLARTSIAPLTEDDTALQGAAKKSLDCSEALVNEMHNIKWKPMKQGKKTVEKRSTVAQVMMAWRCKTKIETLEKDLKDVQQVMDSTILVSNWYAQNTRVHTSLCNIKTDNYLLGSRGRRRQPNSNKVSTISTARSSSSSTTRPKVTGRSQQRSSRRLPGSGRKLRLRPRCLVIRL